MKHSVMLAVSLAFIAIALQGCASIVSGGSQEVSFTSEPEGATVIIDGRTYGKTPMTTNLKRRSRQALRLEKDGYKPVNMQMTTSVNPWFFGNVITGGLLGSSTDAISGAIIEYAPNQYFINLTAAGGAPGQTSSTGEIRTFIFSGHSRILQELHSGPGEYVESLLLLLEVPEHERKIAMEDIRRLSRKYPDTAVFAGKVVQQFNIH